MEKEECETNKPIKIEPNDDDKDFIFEDLNTDNNYIKKENCDEEYVFVELLTSDIGSENPTPSIKKKKFYKPDLTKVHQCDECVFKTPYKKNLFLHIKTVHRQITSVCSYCNKEYKFLKAHIEAVHEKPKSFKCEECDFVCYKRAGLNSHHKRRHTDYFVRQACPICFMKVDVKYLPDHINKVHENPEPKEKTFQCEECPYLGATKNNLLGHTKINHKIIKITCEICDKQINKQKRSSHMRTHMDNQFSCQPCNKTFRERKYLARHILFVHKDHTNTCTHCGTEVTDLRTHVKRSHKDVDFTKIDSSGDLDLILRIRAELGETNVYIGEEKDNEYILSDTVLDDKTTEDHSKDNEFDFSGGHSSLEDKCEITLNTDEDGFIFEEC